MVRKSFAAAALVFLAFAGFLYFNNDVGTPRSGIERDARASQKTADWLVEMDISDTMAALIFYPEDESDPVFSVYVNRPGLSFGYFFRGGGHSSLIERSVAEYTVEGFDERAFLSMNAPKAARLEIDDGNGVQVIEIDSGKPFAMVLPRNAGRLTFYDANGAIVETHRASL